MTNTGFKNMTGWDANGNETSETIMLDGHFVMNLDLSYHFSLKPLHMKDATIGVMLYNLLSTKYDTNGWASPSYTMKGGQVTAYNACHDIYGDLRDKGAVGFAPAAPFNFMAHLSVNF